MWTEDEEYTYAIGSSTGPENWWRINPKWKTCGDGKLQSPIDLLDQRVQELPQLGKLKKAYKSAPAVLKNSGHDIVVSHYAFEWKYVKLITKWSDLYLNVFILKKTYSMYSKLILDYKNQNQLLTVGPNMWCWISNVYPNTHSILLFHELLIFRVPLDYVPFSVLACS